MLNALTIDVEDYFHVHAFSGSITRDQWGKMPLRVTGNTCRVLDLLDEYSIKATFFVLGWVAERVPRLVREIQARGHEIASHGYGHALIYGMEPQEFRDDIRRSRKIIEDTTGEPVRGYRAPTYSITEKSLWALDILIEEGFAYDSSIFPIIHDTYGIPDACRFPHLIRRATGSIYEFPLTTLPIRFAGREFRLPIAGGGYLRLFSADFVRTGISRINSREGEPAVLYFHPWELDPLQPRIHAGMKARFRHYLNLQRTEGKLRRLFNSLSFGPMGEVLRLVVPEMPETASQVTTLSEVNAHAAHSTLV